MTNGERTTMIRTNRTAETAAFLIGVVALGLHMVAEALGHVGYRLGPCTVEPLRSVPWGVLVGSALLIAPKMIGRATAGKIILAGINALTLRLTGKGAATAVLSTQTDGEASRAVAVATLPEGGGTNVVTMTGGNADGLADQHAAGLADAHAVDVEVARAGKAKPEGEET
jgi:hypothetical protein